MFCSYKNMDYKTHAENKNSGFYSATNVVVLAGLFQRPHTVLGDFRDL